MCPLTISLSVGFSLGFPVLAPLVYAIACSSTDIFCNSYRRTACVFAFDFVFDTLLCEPWLFSRFRERCITLSSRRLCFPISSYITNLQPAYWNFRVLLYFAHSVVIFWLSYSWISYIESPRGRWLAHLSLRVSIYHLLFFSVSVYICTRCTVD